VLRDYRGLVTAALIAAMSGAGCTRIEYTISKMPFLAYMRDAPSFDPYEAPRPAPPGSVPFQSPAGESMLLIAPADSALARFGAGPNGTNPFPVDEAFRALGQTMYLRHCNVCHGPQGLGQATGTIAQKDPSEAKYPPFAPNLTLPLSVGRSDGYLYGVIWVGRGLMPSYGPRTNHRERWAIVNYVRQLQTAAGSAGGGN